MFRDASFLTQDAKVLDKMDMTVFCIETVKRYRNFFRSTHINHLWNNEDAEMFLRKIGAIGICKRWEKVYHTPVKIEGTHKNGVDRTVLTLSTGGHEQDVQSMLELYSDLIDTPEPKTDQETTQTNSKSNQKSNLEIGKIPQSNQKTALSNQKTVSAIR